MTHLNAAAAPGLLLLQGTREELEMVRSAIATVIGGETDKDWERCAGIAPAGLTIGVWEVLPEAPAGHLAELIARHLSGKQDDARATLAALTPRELETAVLVGQGLTNSEIGLRMGVGEKTVRNTLHAIFPALGVTNRVQLARLIWEAGLTE